MHLLMDVLSVIRTWWSTPRQEPSTKRVYYVYSDQNRTCDARIKFYRNFRNFYFQVWFFWKILPYKLCIFTAHGVVYYHFASLVSIWKTSGQPCDQRVKDTSFHEKAERNFAQD